MNRPTRHTNTMTGYYTVSGRYVEPLDLHPDSVDVDDIAHSLACQCRFNGHTRAFYSVAEHSIRVARLLAPDPVLELWGLMHDASEAYLCDLPRPLKHASGDFGDLYRDAETKATVAIAEALDLPLLKTRGLRDIKKADLTLLATEKRDLCPALVDVSWDVLRGVTPTSERILHPFSPREAKEQFLRTYERLTRTLDEREAA